MVLAMDLSLTDEQEHLVAAFSSLLAKESSTDRVRAAEPGGFDDALWRSLTEVGIVAMAVTEDQGGWGASMVDLALVAEQLGRAMAPAPAIEAQVAAGLLSSIGGRASRDLLHDALSGDRIVTLAVRPADAGVATLVPAGTIADVVLVLAGDRLLAVSMKGTKRRLIQNLGAMPLADVQVGPDSIELSAGPAARAGYESAIDRWLTLTSSALVGIASKAHELTCSYARDRHAWGVPIGTFQAVAHPLADSATAIDGARLLSLKAAWSADRDSPRHRELSAMAFAYAAESARQATYQGVHFHGGYGFMLEYDVQLYYRRARAWARVWGEPRAAFLRAARARYNQEGGI